MQMLREIENESFHTIQLSSVWVLKHKAFTGKNKSLADVVWQ